MIKIPTNKFTENMLLVRWMLPLERQSITAWNVLISMLARQSEKYPTRQEAAAAVSHAYGTMLGYSLTGYGKCLMVEFRLRAIDETIADDPAYAKELAELFSQFLFHNVLDQESFDESVYLYAMRLKSMDQDPLQQAARIAMENSAAPGSQPLTIPVNGSLEDIDALSLEQMESLRQTLLTTPPALLYCGSEHSVLPDLLEHSFEEASLPELFAVLPEQKVNCVTIERELSQSACVQVYSSGILPDDPQAAALGVLCDLLGSSSVSLLFEEIREKHSYCYSIASALISTAGAMMISTGASRAHMDDVLRLIGEIIQRVIDAEYPDKTLEMVKKERIDRLRGMLDTPAGMLEDAFAGQLIQRTKTLEQRIADIEAVGKEDVAAAARRLKLVSQALVLEQETEEVHEAARA